MSMINQSNGALTAAALSNSDVFAQWEADRELRSNSHGASYVSVPITTGCVFVDWFREHGRTLDPGSEEYRTAHRSNVMLPNMQKAARFIELLRWRDTGVVIDPTTRMVEGWRQKATTSSGSESSNAMFGASSKSGRLALLARPASKIE
jgi:hypothetical protein